MKELNEKQLEKVKKVRQRAQQILSTCEQLEDGEITAEEFESRISKA